jgi:hypothetical protein
LSSITSLRRIGVRRDGACEKSTTTTRSARTRPRLARPLHGAEIMQVHIFAFSNGVVASLATGGLRKVCSFMQLGDSFMQLRFYPISRNRQTSQ